MTVLEIQKQVAESFNVDYALLLSTTRKREVMIARHAAIYLTRKLLKLSFKEIGRAFSRDHATIMHSFEQAHALGATNERFAKKVTLLEEKLRNGQS